MNKVTFTIAKVKDRVKIESNSGLKYQYPSMMAIDTALAAVIFQTIRNAMDIRDIYASSYTLEITLNDKIID